MIQRKIGLFVGLLLLTTQLLAQKSLSLTLEATGNNPVAGITVFIDGEETGNTDEKGFFQIELETQPNIVALIDDEYYPQVIQVSDRPLPLELGTIVMVRRLAGQTETQVEEGLSDEDELDEDISSLLTGSRDLFTSSAAFNWGPLRFNIRGYQSSMTHVQINGFEVNDPENGRINWNVLAGLNDVTRNNYGDISLQTFDFDFGSSHSKK